MEIINVKGNTFCIDTGMTYLTFYKINNEEIIMFDTGWAKRERQEINEILEKNNLKIAGIICTHVHADHAGNNAYFKKKYNCVVAMPIYEALICSSTMNLKLYYSSQTVSDVAEHYGDMVCKTDIMILDDQDEICICNIKFKILHTPGHSPDHISIITPDNVVYLGDALISYEVMRGAKMPYAYILKEDLKTKTKLYGLKLSKYIVAHKGIYNDITKLIADNINFYKNRAEGVYNVIDDNMTLEEIMKSAIEKFNIDINTRYKYNLIERMLRSYVEYLNEIGRIELNLVDGFLRYSKVL